MRAEEYFPEDFLDGPVNIYEAVLIIAKRARQMGELQKRMIDRHLGQTEMLEQAAARARAEESDDAAPPEPVEHLNRPVPKFEKPVVLSMAEMKEKKIEFNYEG
jgi:DNA-directed RNA polymerase subunit K/omega